MWEWQATKITTYLAPLAVLLVVIVLELLTGSNIFISELVVAAPFLAATLVGPRATAVYAVAAVAVAVAILGGIQRNLYDGDFAGHPVVDLIRVTSIAFGGLLAIHPSRVREAALRSVTHVAEVVQHAILSDPPPVIGPVRVAAGYTSAASGARVGGDLYEVVASPFGVRLIIGDTRGKGLDAVRLANRVLGCFRAGARRLADLTDIVADLDAEVATAGGPEDFVTAVVAQIDSEGRVVLANAGHPDPILIIPTRADPVSASDHHPPLGLGAGGPAGSLRLAPRDRLLFYTDGLAEARRPGTREFFQVLPAARTCFATMSLDDGVTGLLSELRQWTRKRLGDDVAILAVQFDPPPDTPSTSRAAVAPQTTSHT